MSTDVRHDCRGCSHSNDSHDPILGCLYPMCMCANKYPARFPAINPAAAEMVRDVISRVPTTHYRPRAPRRERRFWRATWRVLRWFLGSIAAAVLAGLLLAGTAVLAVLLLLARGGQ